MKNGNVIKAAYDALRSYQYGNASPELAESIADALEAEFSEAALNDDSMVQRVVFSISNNADCGQTINLNFVPGISGTESEKFKAMSEEEKQLQNIGGYVASKVMEALKDD